MKKRLFFAWFLICISLVSTPQAFGAPTYSFEIVNSYPHDPESFTQGLIFYEGFLYEGTGLYGQSTLRKVGLQDGAVINSVELPEEFFGEGITILQDQIFQLTWRENLGFVYDLKTMDKLAEFPYSSEGWGLTTDGINLIMSDGSSVLTYLDPETFEPMRQIQVRTEEGPVKLLNELEYVAGQIFANVWHSNFIYQIEPNNGEVIGQIDLSKLYAQEQQQNPRLDVLNGIAYDSQGDRLFVTGKRWSHVYEIRVIH